MTDNTSPQTGKSGPYLSGTHDRREHEYLSTSCLHDKHKRCTGKGARCKFCDAACTCACHKPGPGTAVAITHRRITEAHLITQAATPGDWESYRENPFTHIHSGDRAVAADVNPPDARFITAARKGWPRSLDAITAVLDLHQPSDDAYASSAQICDECSFGEDATWVRWPCRTVRAITDFLGGEVE